MLVPSISKPTLWFFRRIVRGYFRRHFHGVRVNGVERLRSADGPLIIYANHSSWWDPMVSILLAEQLMSDRNHYAPMDATALARYKILGMVGIFPVEMKSTRGAVQFVRTGEAILKSGGVLWVTPQGRFADARVRPLEFKPGMAHLAVHATEALGACTVLPLAIEYPFWNERLPETLLNFGEPIRVLPGEPAATLQDRLTGALETTMQELQQLAVLREASVFTPLLKGSKGVGGFYSIGERIKAVALRRPYQADHTAVIQNDPLHRRQG
jgi:1-acyl-sn-glycerol-3-phosphate acyltransferase